MAQSKTQVTVPDTLPDTYYEALYKDRLGWSQHFIPVRVLNQDLYFEAYLIAPPVPSQSPSRQYIPVKLAMLPSNANDTIHVPVSEIYPTARRLMKLRKGDSKEVRTTVASNSKYIPTPKKVSNKLLGKLEHYMPGQVWTLFELLALFGRPWNMAPILLARCEDLSESGVKFCLITGEEQTAYRIGKVVTVKETGAVNLADSTVSLEREYERCTDCALGNIRQKRGANLVFGRGHPNAIGMIIAESPWVAEERDKKPLHPDAPAGGVLYRVMKKVGLSQEEWFLTNAVICRPLLEPDGPLQKNKPKVEHVKACSTRLKRTLHAVSPKLVVLLGTHAYQAWFGHPPEGGVGRNIGWVTVRNEDTGHAVNYHVFFTYHPSYISRKEGTTGARDAQKLYLTHWQTIDQAYRILGG
jgi:DNA polymerase